jgi:hypothetical protein
MLNIVKTNNHVDLDFPNPPSSWHHSSLDAIHVAKRRRVVRQAFLIRGTCVTCQNVLILIFPGVEAPLVQ